MLKFKDVKDRFHKLIIISFILINRMINDYSNLLIIFTTDFLFDDIK